MPSGEFRASRLGLHLHKGKPVFSSYSKKIQKICFRDNKEIWKRPNIASVYGIHVCLNPAMSFHLCKLALSAFCWNVVFINIGQWTSWEARINTINKFIPTFLINIYEHIYANKFMNTYGTLWEQNKTGCRLEIKQWFFRVCECQIYSEHGNWWAQSWTEHVLASSRNAYNW